MSLRWVSVTPAHKPCSSDVDGGNYALWCFLSPRHSAAELSYLTPEEMGTWAWEQWVLIQGLAKNTEVLEETDSSFLLWGQPPHQKWGLPRVGQEAPLEKEMATHSSILAGNTSWTEEPGRLWPMGSQSQTWLKWLKTHTHKRIVLQPLPGGVHSSWILVGCILSLLVTCPTHSCAAGLCVCVCVLGLECTEESGWVGVSDPDLSAIRHIPGGEGAENGGAMWAPPCGLDPVAPIQGPHWMQGVRRREKGWVPGCQDSGRGLRTHQEPWGSARGRTVCELRL